MENKLIKLWVLILAAAIVLLVIIAMGGASALALSDCPTFTLEDGTPVQGHRHGQGEGACHWDVGQKLKEWDGVHGAENLVDGICPFGYHFVYTPSGVLTLSNCLEGEETPTPTNTPETPTPTPTDTPEEPTPTPTDTPEDPTPTPTDTPTEPTPTPTDTPTEPTPTPTDTPEEPTPTPTNTQPPRGTPTPTATELPKTGPEDENVWSPEPWLCWADNVWCAHNGVDGSPAQDWVFFYEGRTFEFMGETYTVELIEQVDPDETEVLEKADDYDVVLITCRNWTPSGVWLDRFIVFANLSDG